MRAEYVSCNTGIKLGWGPPGNLNEGLGILFPAEWEHEYLGRKRLSGELRFNPFRISAINGPFLSFQLHESRVAFAMRFKIPSDRCVPGYEGRRTLLVAVTHLHVSHAQTPRNEALVKQAVNEGRLTHEEVELLKKQFRQANARRLNEVDELASWLETLRLPDEPALLAGDFNCEPESPPYNLLGRRGWNDLWREAGKSEDLLESATWDAPRNSLTERVKEFQHSGARNHPHLAELLRQADALPRRIDFIMGQSAKSNPAQKSFQLGASGHLLHTGRFGYLSGNPLSSESLVTDDFSEYKLRPEFSAKSGDDLKFVSDHFGVFAEFGITSI
jgi:endonuclease/exonuclease/phosphatase family metal-dependent hydrolase